jgi:hypothetical protein
MTTIAQTYINHINKNDILGFYIASIYIFSKLKTIISTSGNGEMFMVFLRGNANNIHQYLKKNEYIHGVKNKDFVQNETQIWH